METRRILSVEEFLSSAGKNGVTPQSISDITKNPSVFGVKSDFDCYLSLKVISPDEKMVCELIKTLRKDGFLIIGEYDDYLARIIPEAVRDSFLRNISLKGGKMFYPSTAPYRRNFANDMYEFYFIPVSKEYKTLHDFITGYGERLSRISKKYKTSFLMEITQLDDFIKGNIYVSPDVCAVIEESAWLFADFFDPRGTYVSAVMISLTGKTDEELSELGFKIYDRTDGKYASQRFA